MLVQITLSKEEIREALLTYARENKMPVGLGSGADGLLSTEPVLIFREGPEYYHSEVTANEALIRWTP